MRPTMTTAEAVRRVEDHIWRAVARLIVVERPLVMVQRDAARRGARQRWFAPGTAETERTSDVARSTRGFGADP